MDLVLAAVANTTTSTTTTNPCTIYSNGTRVCEHLVGYSSAQVASIMGGYNALVSQFETLIITFAIMMMVGFGLLIFYVWAVGPIGRKMFMAGKKLAVFLDLGGGNYDIIMAKRFGSQLLMQTKQLVPTLFIGSKRLLTKPGAPSFYTAYYRAGLTADAERVAYAETLQGKKPKWMQSSEAINASVVGYLLKFYEEYVQQGVAQIEKALQSLEEWKLGNMVPADRGTEEEVKAAKEQNERTSKEYTENKTKLDKELENAKAWKNDELGKIAEIRSGTPRVGRDAEDKPVVIPPLDQNEIRKFLDHIEEIILQLPYALWPADLPGGYVIDLKDIITMRREAFSNVYVDEAIDIGRRLAKEDDNRSNTRIIIYVGALCAIIFVIAIAAKISGLV